MRTQPTCVVRAGAPWPAASIVMLSLALVGCAMPGAVPTYNAVGNSAKVGSIQLVPVTAQTMPPPIGDAATFPADFLSAPEVDYARLGSGDVVHVRILEGGTPTIFTGEGDLGEMTVDSNGRLFIPFAGSVQAAGRTPAAVRDEVTRRLRTVVRRPQVDIRPVTVRSKLVSVQGTAAKAGTFSIDRGRTRLGELIAEAAPDMKLPEMMEVTVRRDGRSGSARLADILQNPSLNIALQPGDTVVLNDVTQNVTVLGAAGAQGQVRIAERDFSVTDVLGQSRGIDAQAADPRAVYLLRTPEGSSTPIVYQFNMQRPETVALASNFTVHDKDAILISNAPFAQTRQMIAALAQSLVAARSATTIVP